MSILGLTDNEDVFYIQYEGVNIALIGNIKMCKKIMKKLKVTDMREAHENHTSL